MVVIDSVVMVANFHNCALCSPVNSAKDNAATTVFCSPAGDSAGGNLAACVCLKLRDTGSEFRPRLQVLIYPVTQVLDFQLPSYNDPYEIIIGRHAMASYIKFYAGNLIENNMYMVEYDR